MIQQLKYFLIFIFSFATLGLFAEIPRINRRHDLDDREVKNEFSPNYLNAIGSLGYVNANTKIRSRSHKYQNIECGANLIALEKNVDSNLVITASHCVSPNIKKYTWTSISNKAKKIFREGKLLFNDKKNDIALIKLDKKVSREDIKPLLFNNYEEIDLKEENFTVAGFSVDSLGDYGNLLTYDTAPDFVTLGDTNKLTGEIGSVTYQGDSGGAIIYNDIDTDTQYLIGIMSFIEKNKNTFKNEIGKFGNVSGHFVDLMNYESLYKSLFSFITNKVF